MATPDPSLFDDPAFDLQVKKVTDDLTSFVREQTGRDDLTVELNTEPLEVFNDIDAGTPVVPIEQPPDQMSLDLGMTKPPYRVPLMSEIEQLEPNGYDVVSTFSGCGGS